MPNATTMATGSNYFQFQNTLPGIPVALKDAGGTTREYIFGNQFTNNYLYAQQSTFTSAPNNLQTLTYPLQEPTKALQIQDTSTSNGIWSVNNPPALGYQSGINETVVTNFQVNASATYRIAAQVIIPIDNSGNFVNVWIEQNRSTSTNTFIYATPFSVNYATKTLTAGTRLTVGNNLNLDFVPNLDVTQISYDTDNAGHALIFFSFQGTSEQNYNRIFGITYNANTVYASAVTALDSFSPFCEGGYRGNIANIGYLGSANAYCVIAGSWYRQITVSIYQYTVTGTTSAVLAIVGAKISPTTTGNPRDWWVVRTGLTSWMIGRTDNANATINLFFNFVAGTSQTSGTATTTVKPAPAQFWSYDSGSRVMTGFQTNSAGSQILFNGITYAIANAGATGVTATNTTSTTYKLGTNPSYLTSSWNNTDINSAFFYPASGTSKYVIGKTYAIMDTAQTGFNINQYGGVYDYACTNENFSGYATNGTDVITLNYQAVTIGNTYGGIPSGVFITSNLVANFYKYDATPFTF